MVKSLKVNSINKNIDKFLFHRLVSLLKKEFGFEIESLLINFVSSDYILEISKKFLHHDYSTDIITFNYSNKILLFDAELYISLYDAEKNAKNYQVSLEQELLRLVIHGILHLLEYDDMTEKDRLVMKKIENRLVIKYMFLLKK